MPNYQLDNFYNKYNHIKSRFIVANQIIKVEEEEKQ